MGYSKSLLLKGSVLVISTQIKVRGEDGVTAKEEDADDHENDDNDDNDDMNEVWGCL